MLILLIENLLYIFQKNKPGVKNENFKRFNQGQTFAFC